MRRVQWAQRNLAVALFAAAIAPGAVQASAVTFLDHLIITRNLTPLPGAPGALGTYEGAGVFYGDLFSNNLPPPSGGQFFGPTPGSYFIQYGTYGASDESGGKLRLDSALGALTTNAAGQARQTQQVTLPTSINTAQSVAGLIQAFHTFSIYGRFDLTLPDPLSAYGIQIQDNGPGLFSTEELSIQLRRLADNSLVVQSFRQDFLGSAITILDTDPLLIPAGADQIELRLERASLGSDLVTAAYRFWDDGSPMTLFAVMDNPSDFFNNRGWARAGFRAVEAVVPEPSGLALLIGALGALALLRRRGRSRST